MPVLHSYRWVLLLFVVGLCACDRGAQAPPLFEKLTAARSGVTFANTISTSDSVNVVTDVFIYNGGGVAIGDIDNDGLADIFLTGNMVSSRLYRNEGGMRFADITVAAGVETTRWATGVAMVDLDGDGDLDIYVCVSGPLWSTPEERANLLFLNNGDRTFREVAAAYGIADSGFTTHAAFLDYDRDGDLDLYLLGNSPEEFERGEALRHPAGIRSRSTGSYDRLYRNDGDGTFTNVSREAGILAEVGFGLGVAVSDLDRDGWPDIYVSNDVTPSDVLYVNNGDGTFTDKAGVWLKHRSYAGMGIDIADFSNDGWPDILQTDMMPAELEERKRMTGSLTYGSFAERRRRGFYVDYGINTLQLSNGVTPWGDLVFSEVARLAGVAATGWSWSALFGDYDNDGSKDIFITNGYPKAVTDFDYQMAMVDIRRGADAAEVRRRGLEMLAGLRGYELANYVFRNEGDLTFADKTGEWGMAHPGYSYGAAQGDLDNDGRLDLVVNNIDAPAFVYENRGSSGSPGHYLRVVLEGEGLNTRGIGAQLRLVAGGGSQYVYHSPYRGYLSTMEDRVHFGLGRAGRVDTLEVVWPDGRRQVLADLGVDRVVTVRQAEATAAQEGAGATGEDDPVFRPREAAGRGLAYVHRDPTGFVDYSVQPLLPYMVSRQGPPLAVGDVTGNGRDDVFLGGAVGVPGTLLLQRADGRFVAAPGPPPWAAAAEQADWGAVFVDADGDGRLDLYVASGGYRSGRAAWLQDRLYRNEGGGRFVEAAGALPRMPTSTASVAAGDFTGDGRMDLFVGGRLVPRNYPYPARSYLLRNDGGTFTDVTAAVAPALLEPGGMITAAVWVDFTGDGRVDLVTVGEWMPVRFYANAGGRLREVTAELDLPPLRGWWYSLAAGDFNGDGHPDLVAGNLGLNHSFPTAPARRVGVSAGDFTGNMTTDILLTEEVAGTAYPVLGLAPLGRSLYTLGVRFPTYAAFAEASVAEIVRPAQMQEALHYTVDTFASVYLHNDGDGTFTVSPLPPAAQIAPIRGIVAHDVDRNGTLDLLVAGNLYATEPNTPRADAGNGLWLAGDGHGHFTPVPPVASGFLAPRDVTGLALLDTPAGPTVLVANNGDSLQAFTIQPR